MNVLRKSALSIAGGVLIIAGAIMLVTPGPGLLVIGAGIAVWAQEFEWAERLLKWFRAKLPHKKKSDPDKPSDRAS